MKSSPQDPMHETENGALSASLEHNWEQHVGILLKNLDEKRGELKIYHDTLKRLLEITEISGEEVEKVKHTVAVRDEYIRDLEHNIEHHRHIEKVSQQRQQFLQGRIEKLLEHNLKLEEHISKLDELISYKHRVIDEKNQVVENKEQVIAAESRYREELRQYYDLKSKAWNKKSIEKPIPEVIPPLDIAELPPEPSYPDPVPALKLDEEKPYASFDKVLEPNKDLMDEFRCGLDTPRSYLSREIGHVVHIGGWCFDKEGRAPKRVWAILGDKRIPCASGWPREDVVSEFAHQLNVERKCGFNVELSTGPGENIIDIYAEFENGAEEFLFKRLVINLGINRTPKRQLDQDYSTWVECFDSLSNADIRAIEKHLAEMKSKPLISILMPVYNTDEQLLCEVIESVRDQIYPHWELCIADDASPEPHVRNILEEYAKKDERIKIVFRSENGHISASTNSALEVATGEFCALLDHDDLLPKHALYFVANELNEYPETDLIFSDEDKVDSKGVRFDPYFKSDWNHDLFLSHNCISHLGVYRTSILREINGFQEDLFGSQDWDMALRFIEKTDASRIRHIPRILYHWRYLESSTAMSIESKPYAVTAGQKAIENHLKNRGIAATVSEGMWAGAFRVKYHLPNPVQISIIIPTRDQLEVTRQCIDSILKQSEYSHYEILLLNNQSEQPETLEYFKSLQGNPMVRILDYDHPFNFSAINNWGAQQAQGDVLLFLNNDIEVTDGGWLEELVSQAMREEIGAAGGWLLYPDHRVQHAGVVMGVGGVAVEAFKNQLEWNIGHMGRAHLTQNYSAVTGACLATRKDVFEKLGGFNEEALTVAYNDVDYCLRAKRELGLKTVWTPYSKLIHHESISRGYEISDEKKQRLEKESVYMYKNWAAEIEADPYYNPNLTKYDTQFFLAWPPRVNDPWKPYLDHA